MRCPWLTSKPGEAPEVVEAETREEALRQGEATEAQPMTLEQYDQQVVGEACALLDQAMEAAKRMRGVRRP